MLTSRVAEGKLWTIQGLFPHLFDGAMTAVPSSECGRVGEAMPGAAQHGARPMLGARLGAALAITAGATPAPARTLPQLPAYAWTSTGCAGAGGVSFKTKGNWVLGWATR